MTPGRIGKSPPVLPPGSGYPEQFSYSCASDVFEEHKRCCADVYSLQMNGITYDRLKNHALQWPCPTITSRGVARRYRNKIFPTPTGRARFHPVDYLPPVDSVSPQFPLVLNTGRLAGHWHTRTKTGHVAKLNQAQPRAVRCRASGRRGRTRSGGRRRRAIDVLARVGADDAETRCRPPPRHALHAVSLGAIARRGWLCECRDPERQRPDLARTRIEIQRGANGENFL